MIYTFNYILTSMFNTSSYSTLIYDTEMSVVPVVLFSPVHDLIKEQISVESGFDNFNTENLGPCGSVSPR